MYLLSCFSNPAYNIYVLYILTGERIVGQTLLGLFFLPGEAVASAIELEDEDSRGMVRLLINMLFWSLVGLTVTVVTVA